ncbi:T9SS type A sorting domain-containing protein [candidate division KSB1 bacterium]|nr:T9SS type A sorting domain-containing protein [candidate division KSB1 bacterium]
MKAFGYCLLVLALYCSPLWAATVDLHIENDHVEDSSFLFDIFIQRTDDWGSEGLGHADWYLEYNATAFSGQPTLLNVHPAIKNSPSAYQLTAKFNGGLLLVKLVYQSGGSMWQTALNLAERVCTIQLTIQDRQQHSGVVWDRLNTGLLNSDGQPLTETYIGSGDIPLPVELSLFQGAFIDDHVELFWRTETELNNLGFNIYRGITENGLFEKLNSSIIRGVGFSSTSCDYSFVDYRVQPDMIYYYKLEDVDMQGNKQKHGPIRIQTTSLSPKVLIDDYQLEQNFPNPFNPLTTIQFSLKQQEFVNLSVYDLRGKLVNTLIAATLPAGHHSITWNGTDLNQQLTSSGTYFYQLAIPGLTFRKKMALVR